MGLIIDQIADSPGGLKYLRNALVDASPMPVPEDISPDDLIEQIEARVVEGALTFVFLRPYDAPTPGFTVQGEATLVSEDKKNKGEEIKPAPEIPPEYPVMARKESDQVISSTAKLNADLTKLLFGMFGRERRQTTIGRVLVNTAAEQSDRIHAARLKTDITLEVGKWAGGGLDRPKPEVPVEYKNAAKSTGEMAKFATDKLAASLGPHDPTKSGKPAPAVPETFVQVASGTAQGTKSAAVALGSSFNSMLHRTPFVRPPRAAVPNEDGG